MVFIVLWILGSFIVFMFTLIYKSDYNDLDDLVYLLAILILSVMTSWIGVFIYIFLYGVKRWFIPSVKLLKHKLIKEEI